MRRANPVHILAAMLALALALVVTPATPAIAADSGTLTFSGRGWGHGRGMGQYGALGYAVDHGWTTQQILNHFYSPATLATNAGDPEMTVELTAWTNRALIVTAPGLTINGRSVGAKAVRVWREGSALVWFSGGSCNGPWTQQGNVGSLASIAAAPTADVTRMLRVCNEGGNGAGTVYRGRIDIRVVGSQHFAINALSTQDYLQGVVPREMPASWASLSGGRGAQALRAQAVAARSFALSGSPRPSTARTCDTTACQVYGGAGTVTAAGAFTSLEHALSNDAVRATAGWVMRMPGGTVARTEFSSSTGGYTVGGTFAAVPDAGDATTLNPNRTWVTQLTTADAAARLGVGPISSIRVTGRNGLGADGGRVTELTVVSGTTTRTFTGADVRSRLGLRSDWFSVSGVTPAEATAVVKALYADLLGRGVDPQGLDTWTRNLLGGRSQGELVRLLTSSREYVARRVWQAYQDVLLRAHPDPGMESWITNVLSGRFSVDDVARRLYLSQEFINNAGGTDDAWLQRMYQVMLGRNGAPVEIESWRVRIPVIGREGVLDGVWFSGEAARFRASAYYRTFLGRAPDVPGVTMWGEVLLRSGEGAVREGVAGSLEYRSRAMLRFPS